MKYKLLAVYYLCFLLAGAIFLTGCNRDKGSSTDCSENQTFLLERGIAHFSFEYPSCYKTELIEVRNDFEYISIDISGPSNKLNNDDNALVFITIFVQKATDDMPDAEFALENDISFFTRVSLHDFNIIEHSKISFHEIEGHELIYSWDRGVYTDESEQKPEPQITRQVSFDYVGMIWKFDISCDPNVYDNTNIIFNHLLDTFKILR